MQCTVPAGLSIRWLRVRVPSASLGKSLYCIVNHCGVVVYCLFLRNLGNLQFPPLPWIASRCAGLLLGLLLARITLRAPVDSIFRRQPWNGRSTQKLRAEEVPCWLCGIHTTARASEADPSTAATDHKSYRCRREPESGARF